MSIKHTREGLTVAVVAALLLSLLPHQAVANPRKGEVEALYRLVDGRLLKLRTMLPPRRDKDGKERPEHGGCPKEILIGSLQKEKGGKVRNFAPKIFVDGPIVVDCRR